MIPQYVAFEGIDGAGKGTQLRLLAQRLEKEGITSIILHEPSYGTYGRQIRSGLRSTPEDIDDQRALFTEDRIDHVATKVAPALAFIRANPGFVILQSRSILSAAAYQPRGEGDDGLRETIQVELRIAPMPDAIIILDLAVEIALDRIASKGGFGHFERRDRLVAVRERYRRLSELLPVCRLIGATGARTTVASRVYAALEHYRQGHHP